MKNYLIAIMLISSTFQSANACIVAVYGSVEKSLLQNVYHFNPNQITTDTSNADFGIRFTAELKTVKDPIFGDARKVETQHLKADIFENGHLIESTRFHNLQEIGPDATFGKSIKKALSKIGCNLI